MLEWICICIFDLTNGLEKTRLNDMDNETKKTFESFLDVTLEEAVDALDKFDKGKQKETRICICGHHASRHTEFDDGMVDCKVVKYECSCTKFRPVLKSSLVKPFIRTTSGPGTEHALLKGLAGAVKLGAEIEWLVEPKCDKCEAEGRVLPAALNPSSLKVSQIGTRVNQMLCRECIVELS